jgi:hypothetical protein
MPTIVLIALGIAVGTVGLGFGLSLLVPADFRTAVAILAITSLGMYFIYVIGDYPGIAVAYLLR